MTVDGNCSAPVTIQRDDVLWITAAAKLQGLMSAASSHLDAGSHVLLVAHSPASIAELADAAKQANLPIDGLDEAATVSRVAERLRSQPGPCVLLALSGSLRPPERLTPEPSQNALRVCLLVSERYPLRRRDQDVCVFAMALGASEATFHLSLEDPLARTFMGPGVRRMLLTLGATDADWLDSPMINRSIERAQRRLAKACPDHARVEEWLREQAQD
ncbi:MAG TPA: hypothetical protein PK308_07510 [Phycisphaerales bacterium]|nr:hypothetical protein [Phycisphaerales bacterium]